VWVKGEIFGNLTDAAPLGRRMLTRETQPLPFDRFEWFEAIATHCPPPGRTLIVRARAANTDCWLFLMRDGQTARGLASWYTLRFAPVFTGDPPETARRAMLTAIARRMPRGLATLELSPMVEADATAVVAAFRAAGWRGGMTPTSANWTVVTAGQSFADYWAQRPGELRSTVKRKRAKAGMTVTIHDRFDADAWNDYEAVYADSWKGAEGSPAFVRDFAVREGEAGTLRLGVGHIEGRAVAAQLWSVDHGRAIIHKLAYRDDVAALSPGSILTAAMIERAIDTDQVTVIDYGTGDDAYKADWMTDRAPLFTVAMWNPATLAGLAAGTRAAVRALVAARSAR